MTCHPTDPENPPSDDGHQAAPDSTPRECHGAVLLVARELHFASSLIEQYGDQAVKRYRALRPRGLTRVGLAHWTWRFAVGGSPIMGGPRLARSFEDDPEVQHPDFEPPEMKR